MLCSAAMPKKTVTGEKGGAWIFRDIPRELMKRAKIAAAVEGKTIKALILEALDDRSRSWRRKASCRRGNKLCVLFVCVNGDSKSE